MNVNVIHPNLQQFGSRRLLLLLCAQRARSIGRSHDRYCARDSCRAAGRCNMPSPQATKPSIRPTANASSACECKMKTLVRASRSHVVWRYAGKRLHAPSDRQALMRRQLKLRPPLPPATQVYSAHFSYADLSRTQHVVLTRAAPDCSSRITMDVGRYRNDLQKGHLSCDARRGIGPLRSRAVQRLGTATGRQPVLCPLG